MKFSIIASNTSRTVEYLKNLKKNKLKPTEIIYLDNKSQNKISKFLKKKKFFFPEVNLKHFHAINIGVKESNYILNQKVKNLIYSGYSGEIIRNNLLLKRKNLIHSHPGKLPSFKGSTTIYYSILKSKRIFCSTIILGEKIDQGNILFLKEYKFPKKIKQIDEKFDNFIRSSNMLYVIKNFHKLKIKKQRKNNYQPYYVAHPLLRSIVFQS